MPRFFTGDVDQIQARITGEDARHIALSLRMKMGDAATVCDGNGKDYQCKITSISPAEILLQVCAVQPSAGEPTVKITLFQAMPKGDKMETIVQKAVELGVFAVVPVLTERCIVRPDQKAMLKRLERYNRIALETAKQCGRGSVPVVEPLVDFSTALKRANDLPLGIFFYENANTSLRQVLSQGVPKQVAIFIGSEGGFTPDEAEQAAENGLELLSLGSRILRCETAPLAALTAVLYQAGEI